MDDAAAMALGNLDRAVCRPGIDQHDLDVYAVDFLLFTGGEGVVEPFLLIQRAKDDADALIAHENNSLPTKAPGLGAIRLCRSTGPSKTPPSCPPESKKAQKLRLIPTSSATEAVIAHDWIEAGESSRCPH